MSIPSPSQSRRNALATRCPDAWPRLSGPDESQQQTSHGYGLVRWPAAFPSWHCGLGLLAEAPVNQEIFDVVNERDEVIGQAPRSEVHRLGLLHRAVHVLVFNAAGQVFLQKRSMTKDRQPGLWDSSASGHVDSGEDYDTCAVRELSEEIGLQLSAAPKRLFKLAAGAETDQEHVWVYRCEADGPFHLHPKEIERGGWFAPAEVTRWMDERPGDFASALLLIWKKVIRESR